MITCIMLSYLHAIYYYFMSIINFLCTFFMYNHCSAQDTSHYLYYIGTLLIRYNNNLFYILYSSLSSFIVCWQYYNNYLVHLFD